MVEVGKAYFVRTDTDHWVGRVVSIDGPYTLTLESFAWVASCGRLGEFLAKGGPESDAEAQSRNIDIEAAPDGCELTVTYKAAITWDHPLLRVTY